MPEATGHTPIQAAWIAFTGAVRLLLVPQPEDRSLDQYLAFRDMVLTLVESPEFLGALESGWIQSGDSPLWVDDALLIELTAFPLAVEVAQATEEAREGSKEWRSRWLRRASIVASSVITFLPPDSFSYDKHVITLFKALVELFCAKD
jgi:hypothetical protein